MKRTSQKTASRRWPPWILIGALLGLPLFDGLLYGADQEWIRLFTSNQSTAYKHFQNSSDGTPASGHQPAVNNPRRAAPAACERERVDSTWGGAARLLLLQLTANPGSGSKLDFCSEFTKPDSLKIRLMGTPKNHRSPPA